MICYSYCSDYNVMFSVHPIASVAPMPWYGTTYSSYFLLFPYNETLIVIFLIVVIVLLYYICIAFHRKVMAKIHDKNIIRELHYDHAFWRARRWGTVNFLWGQSRTATVRINVHAYMYFFNVRWQWAYLLVSLLPPASHSYTILIDLIDFYFKVTPHSY